MKRFLWFASGLIVALALMVAGTAIAQAPPRPPGPPAQIAPVFTRLMANIFECHIVNAFEGNEDGVPFVQFDSNLKRIRIYFTQNQDGSDNLTIYKTHLMPNP